MDIQLAVRGRKLCIWLFVAAKVSGQRDHPVGSVLASVQGGEQTGPSWCCQGTVWHLHQSLWDSKGTCYQCFVGSISEPPVLQCLIPHQIHVLTQTAMQVSQPLSYCYKRYSVNISSHSWNVARVYIGRAENKKNHNEYCSMSCSTSNIIFPSHNCFSVSINQSSCIEFGKEVMSIQMVKYDGAPDFVKGEENVYILCTSIKRHKVLSIRRYQCR